MKGVLLHGGLGTRLRPLTHTGPKQLIKVAGKPVSQWALEDLREAGVRDVAVVLGNLAPERVVEHYGDGEPTLDSCIGREIAELKERLGVKVAVLTNASLLQLEEVKEDLAQADYVSVKVDAVDEGVWRRVNRPHPSLKLEEILEGALEFARSFRGALTSETMLVRGFNADPSELERIAGFLRELGPGKSYISIPVRPPAEPSAKPPTEREVVEAYSIFASVLGPEKVELLNTPEPPQFEASGDPAEWLLAVASVHPLRYSYAVKALEKRAEEPEKVIEELVRKGLLLKVPYMGEVFLIRNFRRP